VSYRDFTFPAVETQLGLAIEVAPLFGDVTPLTPSAEYQTHSQEGIALGLGSGSDKARADFIIAPIMLEFRRLTENRNAIFSGVEFNVDPAAGLNGFCDFLITRSPRLYIVTAPVIAVAEAKNAHVNTGFGQCIAAMRAAWLFNTAKGVPVTQIFGASTTGTNWHFLRLRDKQVTLEPDEHYVRDVGLILGILVRMVETA